MKKILVMMVIVGSVIFGGEKLTIYTYDSFEWVENSLIGKFEEQYNCDVDVVKFGSTGKVVARLILEKRRPKADVAIGFTPSMLLKAKENDLLEKYESGNISKISNKNLIFDKEFYVTPYDYSSLAVIYNKKKLKKSLKSFEDLIEMKDSLIIQDPRKSSTGQDFLLWTIAIYGYNWKEFWRELKPSILTAAPGWTESFVKFEAGEAPMMISYATDGAYSYHYYNSVTYGSLIPQEGGYVQVEGAGIVKGTKNRDLAEKFIDFMLEEDFQKELPLNQWMFPVIDVELPEAFDYAIKPDKIKTLSIQAIDENMDRWFDEWEEIMY